MNPYESIFDRAAEASARSLAESIREVVPRALLMQIHIEAARARSTASARGISLTVDDCASPDGVVLSLGGRCVVFWRDARGIRTWRGAGAGPAMVCTATILAGASSAVPLPDSTDAMGTIASRVIGDAVTFLLSTAS